MSDQPVPTSVGPGVVVEKKYRVVEALGQGGMGAIWVAEHGELGRRVALKVLQKQIGRDPEMRQRLEREAKTLAAMSHPNVVGLVDYGVWGASPFLVMELLEGRTLRDLLDAEGPLPFARARHVCEQILRALAYAHGRDVIHRDLKPGNVFLQGLPDDPDHVRLLDFGFAKFLHGDGGGFVSKEGVAVGTPAYMAPEQGRAEVDARADVYSVGVMLFEMLVGVRPFEGEPLEILRARLARDAPSLAEARPGVVATPALDRFLARALAREPASRFASAAEMATALAALSDHALSGVASARPPPRPSSSDASPRTEALDSKALADLRVPPSWRRPVLAGVAIGALVTAWALIMVLTGWALDPATQSRFALVVVLELVVLFFLLRAGARDDGFRAQVGTGTAAALVAAPIVVAQSLVMTTVIAPELVAAHPENGGPLAQALAGAVGTIATGVVGSALFATFLRRPAT